MLSGVTTANADSPRIVFAPIATIMKYDTVDEAIRLANNTRYGLGARVFGPDQEQCVELVAKHLHCGMVSINDFAVFYVSLSSSRWHLPC